MYSFSILWLQRIEFTVVKFTQPTVWSVSSTWEIASFGTVDGMNTTWMCDDVGFHSSIEG